MTPPQIAVAIAAVLVFALIVLAAWLFDRLDDERERSRKLADALDEQMRRAETVREISVKLASDTKGFGRALDRLITDIKAMVPR